MVEFLNRKKRYTTTEAIAVQVMLIMGVLCAWNIYAAVTRFEAESEDRNIDANAAQLQVEETVDACSGYIAAEHPEGETCSESNPRCELFRTLSPEGEWLPSLSRGYNGASR